MFENERCEQFVGFVVWFVMMGAAIYGVQSLGADSAIASQINKLSPWIGAHMQILATCVALLIFCAGVTLPALSMFKCDGKLEMLGFVSIRLLSAIAIPIILFVLGAAWYSGHY